MNEARCYLLSEDNEIYVENQVKSVITGSYVNEFCFVVRFDTIFIAGKIGI